MARKRREDRLGTLAVDITAAARALTCSPEFVRKLVGNGQIKASKAGRRWFIEPKALEEFLEARRVSA